MFRRGGSLGGFVKATQPDPHDSSQYASAPEPRQAIRQAWTEHKSAQGQKYYYNEDTKQSTWVRPDELGPEETNFTANPEERREQAKIEQMAKRKRLGEDTYFEESDEESEAALRQARVAAEEAASFNPFADDEEVITNKPKKESSDEEDDPLDAFMAGINETVKEQSKKKKRGKEPVKPRRDDLEEDDDFDTFMVELAKREEQEDTEIVQYDDDGYPIREKKASLMEVMPPVDHTKANYIDIGINFYEEHEDIRELSPQSVQDLRRKLGLKASGHLAPKPIVSFAHCGFDENMMSTIRKIGYSQPTAIQAQALPAALSGRDVIGIAKTGSGKTAAFVWPMIVHIMDQPELDPKEVTPIGLIVAPTRELCLQITTEAKRFAKAYGLNVVAVYGGANKYEQLKSLKGCEIVVAVPGRLVDYLKSKEMAMHRCSFLVLDEADRMFSMGFEPQIRSIVNQIRPDRQTLLFSATFKKTIERLARDILTDPIRIVVGAVGEANQDVTQLAHVIYQGQSKWDWLTKRLVEFTSSGTVLIFVTKKANAIELAENMQKFGYPETLLLHGDMAQTERSNVISKFKKKVSNILVATDVAARGLDIPHVRTVVNFDIARDIDTHTHRIGRTGRAGVKGIAHTLVESPGESFFAGQLVKNMELSGSDVPQALLALAKTNKNFFRKDTVDQGGRGQGRRNRGGRGGRRAGLGSTRDAGWDPRRFTDTAPGQSYNSFVPAKQQHSYQFSGSSALGSAQGQSSFLPPQQQQGVQSFNNNAGSNAAAQASFARSFVSATSAGSPGSSTTAGGGRKKSRFDR